MKLLTYWQAEQLKLGIKLSTEDVLPAPISPAELYAGGVEAVETLNGWLKSQSSNDGT